MSTTAFPAPRFKAAEDSRPSRLRSLVRGRTDDPAWVRPALFSLLALTAVAYVWDLTASGNANSFYAAAVQAGTKSWKAFFFGSIDSSNFITVDKPPASLWVMSLSGRIFGFSSASMLVPQVLEGVISVGLLYAAVRRWFGAGAGLVAGALMAITPVAALMFRFNNPDALLVCLLVASAYCLVRALEHGRVRWMLGVGTLIGVAFLAKMSQAFLVVPGFALVYLVAAPTSARRRIGHLLAGGLAMLLSAGWWVAAVELWPASSRPMIDGSSKNSIIDLIVNYNGLGRLSGGSGGGGGGGGMFSGQAGLLRLFNSVMGGQASWLLPVALAAFVGGLLWRGRAPRTDRTRAALLLWGSWLVVSGLVFSLGSGVIHTYYTIALAPAIAGLVAIGAALLWARRETIAARALMSAGVTVTAVWAIVLLGRTSSWEPWLTPVVAVTGVAAIAALLVPAPTGARIRQASAVLAAVACLAGPAAYTAQALSTAHTGSTPSAGPEIAGSGGGPGGGAGGRRFPGGSSSGPSSSSSRFAGGPPSGIRPTGSTGGMTGGGAPDDATTSAALVSALKSGATGYRWVAATSGSQSAASLELASGGLPVMAIGGFSGSGGNLTLTQFEQYVKSGDIHYYIASGGGMGGGAGGPGSRGSGSTSSITNWVKAHYTAKTIGSQTVYDLTAPKS